MDENDENINPVLEISSGGSPEVSCSSKSNIPNVVADHSNDEVASSSSPKTERYDSSSSDDESENLEKCATKYFAGYLADKTIKKFKCQNCKKCFLSKNIFISDKNEILLFHKLYKNIIKDSPTKGLKTPSEDLYKITRIALKIFRQCYDQYCSGKNVAKNILNKIATKIKRNKMNGIVCNDHLQFLLKLIVTTKIFKETRSMCSKSSVKFRKLNILQNI